MYVEKNKFISRKEPPIHPGALPIIGHAHLLIGDTKHIWELIKKCSYECMATGNVTYNIAGRKYYVITDPDDCLTISNACLEKDLIYRFAKGCYGDGLVTASQSTWKKHRNLLNPQFNLNYLNGFLVIFNKQSRILVKEFALMAGRGPFDHGSIIRQNEIKTICATSLGVDFNEDKKTLHEYATAFDIIFNCCTEIIKRFWLQIRCIWLRSSLKKQRDKYRIIMHNITDEIIKKRNDDRKNEVLNVNREGKAFRPFLDIFFDLKETVGDEMMPDKTIRDHVNTLILAGHDTIATAVQFTLILIGSYPKVQERLYMELVDIFGDSIRDVEKDDLTRLRYLEAVLKESLRFYTIVPIVARDVTKDVDLKNYTLKAGGACLLMLHGVHRLPMWGKDVEEFKPERWLNPATLPKNPNTFLTFSLGKRVCIAFIASRRTGMFDDLISLDLKVEVGRAPFDHDPYIRRTAMEAICLTAFGVNFSKNNDLNDRYRHASESLLKILCERFQKFWLHNEFIWNLTSTKKKHDELVKELHSISNMVVQNRKKKCHSKEINDLDLKGEKFKPFLDLLFELYDSNGKEAFSEQEIREHVDTFIVAGHDTVAGTLVFTLLLIGSYPEVQEKICEELQEVFGESDRNVTKEDLARLVYLEAVLKETMRVYPVVPVVARKVDTDVQLKNYTLSSGNTCVLLYVGVHRHPIWGENPEQFKPERWLQQSTLPENTNAFVAFGLGRRVCIARPYAMFIMKTIISHVLRHYRVSGDHLKMVNTFDCLLKPATGHYISLERRTP